MIEIALIISLKIIAIHVCFWDGMIFAPLIKVLYLYKLNDFIKKPLYGCVICMSSFWTILFYLSSDSFEISNLFPLILIVCGINSIASFALIYSPYNLLNKDL